MFGTKTQIISLVVCFFFAVTSNAYNYDPNNFATEVFSSKGPFGGSPYDDPYSVLGKPTTKIYDAWSFEIYSCSLVYPAWATDPNGDKLITTLDNGSEIVIKFNHKVADDPGNPYGVDFIVFGNSFFEGNGWIEDDTNMEQYFLKNPTAIFSEPVVVSISQDGNDWYTYLDGPYADAAFPTNAYAWDSNTNNWGQELDWTRPVDPNLTVQDFDGLSVATAIEFYDGSAGGTGFDIKDIDPNDYAALAIDPNTGQKWIQYIKVQSSNAGEIDGFADVSGCGDYKHPFPVGDLNEDCRVDYQDMELMCYYWLADTSNPNDPAIIADIYEDEDNTVNFYDWTLMAENWLKCTWECE